MNIIILYKTYIFILTFASITWVDETIYENAWKLRKRAYTRLDEFILFHNE